MQLANKMLFAWSLWFVTDKKNDVTYKFCRLSHFDYVKSEDLERIGMGKPAIRRLVDAVKKRNRKKNLFDKVVFHYQYFNAQYTVHSSN